MKICANNQNESTFTIKSKIKIQLQNQNKSTKLIKNTLINNKRKYTEIFLKYEFSFTVITDEPLCNLY